MDLTAKQKEILNVLKKFIEEKGYSPSFRELGELAHVNSSATVAYHLVRLKDKGYVDYIPKQNRTIRITKEWD